MTKSAMNQVFLKSLDTKLDKFYKDVEHLENYEADYDDTQLFLSASSFLDDLNGMLSKYNNQLIFLYTSPTMEKLLKFNADMKKPKIVSFKKET